ncbi:hypothetical protein PIB30_029898 [Stylosanthes scabra]|uniref:Uncharacterized protein n=1 Tax=Stylosanthes scabra TaxID=79078 RepID=A0ABU6RBZ4_9FABA|nr:hypothetical protein [Stylosanthes scabra]
MRAVLGVANKLGSGFPRRYEKREIIVEEPKPVTNVRSEHSHQQRGVTESNWAFKRGLALARKLEISILAFIKNLPNATVQSHGEERAVAWPTLTPYLTAHRAVAREDRAAARCGQDLPK